MRHKPILVTLCLAVLVGQLDTAVVNLATRPIGQQFATGVNALQWVVDSYNLVFAVMLLTGGLLADVRGRRRLFTTGLGIFTLGTIVCAAAPAAWVLIGGRAVAGLGAALMVPASLAILRVAWPDEVERGRALGIWTACNGVGLAVGPTLGGILIDAFSWRSVFLVTVPFSVAAIFLARAFIEESASPTGRDFDGAAQLCGGGALGALALGAIELHQSVSVALIAFAAAIAAFVLFLRIESTRGEAALVPLAMFRVRTLTGASVAMTGMTFGMYGAIFLLPLVWQTSGRYDSIQAGLALTPMAVTFTIVSPFSARLSEQIGGRMASAAGVGTIAAGLLLIAGTVEWPSDVPAAVGLALTGAGMGMATGPLMGAAVGAVSSERAGTASALINVMRMAGATIGVAILGTIYALAGAEAEALRLALLVGAAVQLGGGAIAWMTMPAPPTPRRKGDKAASSLST